ncbi:hypothetical protein DICSQDRAFT_180044 [Dichomitus squalens LYAD-421 SS1]|uniref:Uncharacterized protein n=1 Tax=Dichomitus squalens (strain LYAD-421) TaxID=732165 RepID=R7T1M1_DICSQ|nr:uncharacterized protein DICSQDRAFT_180044 [Dichomitus squalens LYAD-421 SS1]EJF62153.1 hypothetical protein DICSQDRAFT_180044 [Dichomitus squalens LYAD-421 SS1]
MLFFADLTCHDSRASSTNPSRDPSSNAFSTSSSPASGATTSTARTPPAQYSTCPPPALPIPPPEAPTSAPVPQSATPERPSIRLEIPMGSPSEQPVSPLSPIVFSIPGSREVRMRREQELARRMKDSGFQEARSPTEPPDHKSGASELTSGPSRSRVCAQELSPAYTDSDDERDVVLLLEHDSDMEECPTRSASRAAMLALFSDGDDESDSGSVPKLWQVPEHEHERRNSSHLQAQVDVKVEVVTREAVARTKRRFSRKWIRERRGKRWTEDDFGEIISQLRKLR